MKRCLFPVVYKEGILLNGYSTPVYEERINRVLDYIEQDMDKPISLQSLAETACFSPYHFHRIFTAWIGETPIDYVRRIRLEKAAMLLVHKKSVSITEIALQCGFSSSSVFSRTFQNHFHTSPRAYRQKHPGKLEDALNEPYRKPSQRPVPGLTLSDPVKLEHFPAYAAVFARYQGGYNKGIGSIWGRLMRWAFAHNVHGSTAFGIPLDDPEITPAAKCRYLACLAINPEIAKTLKLPGYLSLMEIPGGLYAVSHFEGEEKNITRAYNGLYGDWLPASGFEPADSPALDVYYSDARERAAGKFRFDIRLPLKPL